MKEKDDLQSMLGLTQDKLEEYKSALSSQVVQGASNSKVYVREETEDEGIYKELADRMQNLHKILMEQRKKQKAPSSYPKKEDFAKFTELGAYPTHESTKPGIIDLDIHPVSS